MSSKIRSPGRSVCTPCTICARRAPCLLQHAQWFAHRAPHVYTVQTDFLVFLDNRLMFHAVHYRCTPCSAKILAFLLDFHRSNSVIVLLTNPKPFSNEIMHSTCNLPESTSIYHKATKYKQKRQ